jgi:Coenzyme PQQ synthesis protein D (PqqD)
MMNPNSCPKRGEQVIAQKAENDTLLFNMNDGNYYSLNEIGGRIWELCDGNRSVSQLITALAAEYDASGDVLEQDVMELLEGLKSGKLIV